MDAQTESRWGQGLSTPTTSRNRFAKDVGDVRKAITQEEFQLPADCPSRQVSLWPCATFVQGSETKQQPVGRVGNQIKVNRRLGTLLLEQARHGGRQFC